MSAYETQSHLRRSSGGLRFDLAHEELEKPSIGVGDGQRVAFEIHNGRGIGVLRSLVRKAIHVGGPEGEVLAHDEIRMRFDDGSRGTG